MHAHVYQGWDEDGGISHVDCLQFFELSCGSVSEKLRQSQCVAVRVLSTSGRSCRPILRTPLRGMAGAHFPHATLTAPTRS